MIKNCLLAAMLLLPTAAFAHEGLDKDEFTNEAWQSYGLNLSEEKEIAINTIRFDQQRDRFHLTNKYIAQLPADVQAKMAEEMAAIDAAGDAMIQSVLSPEERAEHAKLKAEHEAHAALWAEFEAWKKQQGK